MPNIIHGAIKQSWWHEFLAQAKERFLIRRELTLEIPHGTFTDPDLAVLPKRASTGAGNRLAAGTCPPLVVEIVSPSQGYQIIVEKIDLYFAHGVQSVWEVNPALKYIAIHRRAKEPRIVQHGEVTDPPPV